MISKHETVTINEQIHPFGNTRHILEYDTIENLMTILKEFLRPNIKTGIDSSVEDLCEIKDVLLETFPG